MVGFNETRRKTLAQPVAHKTATATLSPAVPNHPRRFGSLHLFLELNSMAFFKKLRDTAGQAAHASVNAAASSVDILWSKYGNTVCEIVLKYANEAAERGRPYVIDDEKYKQTVVDPAWEVLPTPIRLIGRERLRWDEIFGNMRTGVFAIDGDSVGLRPDAKHRLNVMFTHAFAGRPSDTTTIVEEATGIEEVSSKTTLSDG